MSASLDASGRELKVIRSYSACNPILPTQSTTCGPKKHTAAAAERYWTRDLGLVACCQDGNWALATKLISDCRNWLIGRSWISHQTNWIRCNYALLSISFGVSTNLAVNAFDVSLQIYLPTKFLATNGTRRFGSPCLHLVRHVIGIVNGSHMEHHAST